MCVDAFHAKHEATVGVWGDLPGRFLESIWGRPLVSNPSLKLKDKLKT